MRDAAERDGERRQLGDRDLGEEERAAPQHREADEQQPVGGRHREAGGVDHAGSGVHDAGRPQPPDLRLRLVNRRC